MHKHDYQTALAVLKYGLRLQFISRDKARQLLSEVFPEKSHTQLTDDIFYLFHEKPRKEAVDGKKPDGKNTSEVPY